MKIHIYLNYTPVNKNRTLYYGVGLLSLVGLAVIVRRILSLLPVLAHGYTPPSSDTTFARLDDIFRQHPILTLVHILAASVFILLGPFQFSPRIRYRFPAWHRRSGRVFLIFGGIVGITALVMSFAMPSIGGVNQAAATVLFGLFFCFALYKAFTNILRRNIGSHREWMIRAYSIGLAVATIRLIVGIFFATMRWSGLTPDKFFGTAFWIGFVLHLIAAEAWIYHTRRP
jgi:hypothetical protein